MENIPLLSWLVLRGRCHGCQQPIAWRYPLIELATALLFLLCQLTFGLHLTGIATMAFCFLLLGLAAMDAESMTLPDSFTLPGIGLGLLYAAIIPQVGRWDRLLHIASALLSGALAALFLLLIRWIYYWLRHQEGLGLGDVKLLAMIAVWMGPRLTGEVLFFGVLAAALYGLLWARRANAPLPLGSFLCASALFVTFRGEAVLHWYLHFFP
jgi:leader peptidase (prepilin peptidase) / N-methyltransferase